MFEKFNGIIFFAIFIIHFIGFAYYGFRCVFQTKSFLAQYGMDDTGAIILPYLSYLFFDSFYFSRFCNIFFHFLTGYMFLKSRDTIKGRFVTIIYLYNPIMIRHHLFLP